MICDLGGGTQDMQILTIKAVKPQVQLEEAVPGQA